ncbi:hypothetical protein, partial [Actinocorallia lasiicapitis]
MSLMCRPALALPAHRVELDTLVRHVESAYAGHPRLADAVRGMRATSVATRHYCRPMAEVVAPPPLERRIADQSAS